MPPEGTEERKILEKVLFEQGKSNPAIKNKIEVNFQKGHTIISAQNDNGADLPIDKSLREFLIEYNGRNFQYGLSKLPSSLNVMEAFFEYNPELSIFKLNEEKDHLVSFIEFLDYYTSTDSHEDLKDVLMSMQEGVIYSYNILNNPADITFSIDNNIDYVIGGISLVRHESEISILALTGEKANLDEITEQLRREEYIINPDKKMIQPAKDLAKGAVALFGNHKYWRVLVLTRLDLEDDTQSVRYILKDIGNGYLTSYGKKSPTSKPPYSRQ